MNKQQKKRLRNIAERRQRIEERINERDKAKNKRKLRALLNTGRTDFATLCEAELLRHKIGWCTATHKIKGEFSPCVLDELDERIAQFLANDKGKKVGELEPAMREILGIRSDDAEEKSSAEAKS